MHTFGKFKYDPGKYYGKTTQDGVMGDERDAGNEDVPADAMEQVLTAKVTHDDEIEAPWNQYAWIEELNLRVRTNLMQVNSTVNYPL